ncbi:MAG: S9 family peptidase [Candidatus Aminicenantes bacterium]|nr:S9 family peptidase [Candidatus Aminicenantes bacterium]
MKMFLMLVLAFACALHAAEGKRLTFEQVFLNQGEPLLRPLPEITGWIDDSSYGLIRDGKVFRVAAYSGRARLLLDPSTLKATGPDKLDWLHPADRTADFSSQVFLHEDDLYLLRGRPAALKRLTTTAAAEKNPRFSPDGRRLAFTAGNDLYVCDAGSGAVTRLTFDGSEEILNGYASWVYYEEILGRAGRYRAFEWSPDGKRIAFLRFDQGRVPCFPLFEAQEAYGRLEMQRYPKPGFPNPEVRIGIVDLGGGKTDWISFPDSGEHYLTFLAWSPRGEKAYLQWLNRGQDELKIYEYALGDKSLRQVYRETQKTWVDHLESGSFHPLSGGGFLLLSDKSGWNHLYLVDEQGGERALSSGAWAVAGIEFVDEKRGDVICSAAREDSTCLGIYRMTLAGAAPRRLVEANGVHRADFSKAGSYFIDRFSTLRQPAVLRLHARDGRLLRRLGDSVSAEFGKYALAKAEIFRLPSVGDEPPLPAVWLLPPDFDPGKRYPAVLSIYGGPGAKSVLDGFPRRLGDHYLAQEGIIVIRVDHRGSGHFGKRGMDAMHRNLGKWELADYGRAVAYLRTLPFIDGGKIGISGGSYGGYVAALAVVSAPDTFPCGIAEYAVTDWSLYDSVYTERYMDTPQENPDGYRQASVLSHLDSYRGGLRLTHGSMDDNVHMQNTLQLLDGILERGRSVELMIYPGQRHGVRGRKAAENARATVEFWKRRFFPEKVGSVRPVGPVRQEKAVRQEKQE